MLLLFQHSGSTGVHIFLCCGCSPYDRFVLDLSKQQLPDLQECKSLRPGEGRTTDGSTSAPEWCGGGEGSLQNHDCRLQAVVEQLQIQGLGQNEPCKRHHRALLVWLRSASAHLNSPCQPGLVYFLTPRKCGLFGMCFEGLPHKANYFINEAAFRTYTPSSGRRTYVSSLQ